MNTTTTDATTTTTDANAPIVESIGEGRLLVCNMQINSADWVLIRRPGRGTYMEFAASFGLHDDYFVVEECGDQQQRELWDEMSDVDAAVAAYGELIASEVLEH